MGLNNCPECGRVYVENASGLCAECLRREEESEQLVVDYLRDRGKASVKEISRGTGVKEKTVLRMMHKGRFIGEFAVTYPCESCGAQITKGRLCDACGNDILRQIKQVIPAAQQKAPAEKKSKGMYTKDM